MAVYYKQVRLPADVLEALGDHSGHWWSDPELEPVIVEVIRAFIKPVSATRQQPAGLRFPGSEQWLLADVCRAQQNAAIARLFGGDAQTAVRATPPQPVPASRAKRTGKPQSKPKKKAARPSNMAAKVQSEDEQRKHGAGRSARRKRRTRKHVPGNP
ncbi:MAG TPA: hypothetical protein VJ752_11505 [Burkholderiaceae bacterium]|nr:hypothetical protein [Burkholderiaceae bacterium]